MPYAFSTSEVTGSVARTSPVGTVGSWRGGRELAGPCALLRQEGEGVADLRTCVDRRDRHVLESTVELAAVLHCAEKGLGPASFDLGNE